MKTHGKTPYQILKGGPDWSPVIDAKAILIAQMTPVNAKFMVKACNAHEALEEAVRCALVHQKAYPGSPDDDDLPACCRAEDGLIICTLQEMLEKALKGEK